MKKYILPLIICILCFNSVKAQDKEDYFNIDRMLIKGDFEEAADTCKLILANDSTNAMVWYKLGLARQNLLPDTSSLSCYMKAHEYAPDNNLYKFTVAKIYLGKNRNNKAKPLLNELYKADSLNWQYAHYLSGIYIQEGNYDQAISMYREFFNRDSGNYVILDKLGFAYLRKSEYLTAIDYYNRSLAINPKNTDAIRNLSFLYPYANNRDTAITLLTRAIKMDPEDIDLYARRATLYFSKNYTKRALDDYLRIMSLGDSSFLYLKRAGIGYLNNLQPKQALPYLFKAHAKDTTDFETLDFIAQCYSRMKDYENTAFYYRKLITTLQAYITPLGLTYMNLGQALKSDSLYTDAIESYSKAYEYLKNPAIMMMVANTYDENLGNKEKALAAYKQFMASEKKMYYMADYIESIKKRMEFLEEKIAEEKAKKEYKSGQSGTKK